MTNTTHSTHKMRYSDSSYYDEICDSCMEPDPNTHTNVKLTEPCLKKTDKLFDNELTNDIAYFQEKLDELNKAVAITEKQLELLKDAVVIYRGL